MEKLLRKYLPVQKKDRRRAFFVLLLSVLLIGGGAFLIISKPWTNNSHFTEQLSQDNKNKPQTKNTEKASSDTINFTNTKVNKKNTAETADKDLPAQSQIKEISTGKTINRPFPNSQKNIQQPILKNQLTSDKQRNLDVNNNNKEKVEPINT